MSTEDAPTWSPPAKPSFNSPAADLNQLRNEAKRIAESAPGQSVHKSVLEQNVMPAGGLERELHVPEPLPGAN